MPNQNPFLIYWGFIGKSIASYQKVHYLTLKGMREKIYAYLTDIYTMQHSEKLVLPHNREQMAEALSVSRTALSRELGRCTRRGVSLKSMAAM